jgi:hypothetical protein
MKAMLKKGPRRPNLDGGGLGPGAGWDRSGGPPDGLRRAGALLSCAWCVCVLMAVLLRWRGSFLRIVAWEVGMSGPVSRNGNGIAEA